MADAAQLTLILARFEEILTRQTAATDALAAQAALTEARFAQGDANLQSIVTALEARVSESETKLAAALAAVASRMSEMQSSLEQRLSTASTRVDSAMRQMAASAAASANATPGPAPQSATPASSAAPGQVPATTPQTTGSAGHASSGTPDFDPWARAAQAPPLGGVGGPGAAQQFFTGGGDWIKSKDFAQIGTFDGDLNRFADWADRMSAKMNRAHPRLAAMLIWAERQPDQITMEIELNSAEQGLDVVGISGAVYDVLMERTGARLFDKRRNAGAGRGLEFWRILKRDYGMESNNAQMAKLSMYFKPAKCTTVNMLGEALDRWEALGREITQPMSDDFKLLALRELVPKSIVDMMATQVSLQTFSAALMFVRRQVADHRHANQVQIVQRGAQQGPAPMDVSTLWAAIAQLRDGGGSEENAPDDAQLPQSDLDNIIAALKGKGKGKGKESKGKGKGEDRTCYNCGTAGHLSRDCPAPQKHRDAKGTKGQGKGKSWGVHHLGEEHDDGISLGCLMRGETSLNAISTEQPETWEGYEMVEALMDSGAGECVCGPQHFSGIDMKVDPGRAGAGTEYICADGGRIPNMGEKSIPGLSDEGSRLAINFQVTTVDRPLIAVSKLTAAGHDVWFGQHHGVITHGSTGKQTTFAKRNGVYVLRIWAPHAQMTSSGGSRQ
jgi:hypothetical protein